MHLPSSVPHPPLSRFEKGVDSKQLYRMGEALAEGVIERHRRRLHGRARRITIDLDPTDDPTHGAQQRISVYPSRDSRQTIAALPLRESTGY